MSLTFVWSISSRLGSGCCVIVSFRGHHIWGYVESIIPSYLCVLMTRSGVCPLCTWLFYPMSCWWTDCRRLRLGIALPPWTWPEAVVSPALQPSFPGQPSVLSILYQHRLSLLSLTFLKSFLLEFWIPFPEALKFFSVLSYFGVYTVQGEPVGMPLSCVCCDTPVFLKV